MVDIHNADKLAQLHYLPRNPDKYAGDPRRIVARSKWEIAYMRALDTSPLVTKWLSEPRTLQITYKNPLNGKPAVYWPDFLVQYADGNVELIEIKPQKEASMGDAKSTYDKLMLAKNIAKWQAAERFAKSIGARFRVVTEQQLFRKSAVATKKRSRPSVGSKGSTRSRSTKR